MRCWLLAAVLILPLASCSGPAKPPAGLPSVATVNIKKGQAYLADKNYDAALASFEEALTHQPTNAETAEALVGRGRTYAGKGNYDQAIADFAAVPNDDPNAGLAHLYSCLARAEKEEDFETLVKPELEAAKKHDLHGINADQELAAVYARHGTKYQEAKDLGADGVVKAEVCYEIAKALDDKNSLYRFRLAVIYDGLKDWNRAIGEYEDCVLLGEPAQKVAQPLSFAYLHRAQYFKDNHQLEQARADYEKAVNLNPNLRKHDREFKK